MDGLPDFIPGEDLRAEQLQALVDYIRRNKLVVTPGSGLFAVETAAGQAWRALPGDKGDWFKIESHVSLGHYKIRRQIDTAGGGWADATPTNDDGYESNGVSSLPNGLVVWVEPAISATGVIHLKFTKGVC